MRIGYLQLSPQQTHESGIVRYARYIAQAVAALPEVEVQTIALPLDPRTPFQAPLQRALEDLRTCDVLHLQYSKYLGLSGWNMLKLLKTIRRQFTGKLCITLHDVYVDLYPAYGLLDAWKFENKRLRGYSNQQSLALRSTATCLWQNHLADKAVMQWILNHADQVLTCSQTEAERLQHFDNVAKVTVIPHFIETRAEVLPVAAAKQALGFKATDTLITLQGFIYRSKGHALLIEALSLLPNSIQLVFAGGMAPNQADLRQELEAQIQRLGLGDRVRITGHLSESDLECYLAASDLGVCPFQIISASGTLSTWISMGRPVLAYDLPQVEELNQRVPGAIATFLDYTPESLAEAIETCLVQPAKTPLVQQLQEKLSLAHIAQLHGAVYAAPSQPALTRPTPSVPSTAEPMIGRVPRNADS